MNDDVNKVFTVLILCVTLGACTLFYTIMNYNINELERDKEFAKQGLHQQGVPGSSAVVWVK